MPVIDYAGGGSALAFKDHRRHAGADEVAIPAGS
jgi:hypothetical protein